MNEKIEALKKKCKEDLYLLHSVDIAYIEYSKVVEIIDQTTRIVLESAIEEVGKMHNSKEPKEGAPFTDYVRAGWNNALKGVEQLIDKMEEML